MRIDYVLLSVACIIIAANFIYMNSKAYKNSIQQFIKFNRTLQNAEIINIGSFPSLLNFKWEVIGVNGVNLGVGPEENYYDWKLLKYFIEHNPGSNYTVVHLITPLLFCENKYTKEIKYNKRYSAILPYKDVRVPLPVWLLERYLPVLFYLYESLKNDMYVLLKKQKILQENGCNASKQDQADALIQGWLCENPRLHNFTDGSQIKQNKEFADEQIRYLKEIISLCDKKGLHYVAVIGPVSAYIRSFFSPSFVDSFIYSCLEAAGLDWHQWLDYFANKEYENMSCYTNGLFLTDEAAIRFSKDVYDQLEIMGYVG